MKKPELPTIKELSPAIERLNKGFDAGGRSAFHTLYKALFEYAWKKVDVDSITFAYAIPKVLERSYPKITLVTFMTFMELWHLSDSGEIAIDSRKLVDASQIKLGMLRKLKLIERKTINPYDYSDRSAKDVFIIISHEGKKTYRNVMRMVREYSLRNTACMITVPEDDE